MSFLTLSLGFVHRKKPLVPAYNMKVFWLGALLFWCCVFQHEIIVLYCTRRPVLKYNIWHTPNKFSDLKVIYIFYIFKVVLHWPVQFSYVTILITHSPWSCDVTGTWPELIYAVSGAGGEWEDSGACSSTALVPCQRLEKKEKPPSSCLKFNWTTNKWQQRKHI